MFDYNTQILIFSFLDVQDIYNVIATSKLAYLSRDIIVRDIWSERYPELFGFMDHNLFNMFYVDIVFEYLTTCDLNSIMKRLNLEDLHDRQCNTLEEYESLKVLIDGKFSVVVSKLQNTYDRLHNLLMYKLRQYEDEDEKYGEDDFEMFTYALMEYGHKIYRDVILSNNPYLDGTIDDDMINERSVGIWFEEEEYSSGVVVEDINMDDVGQELFYNCDGKLLEQVEELAEQCDCMDDFEYECSEYNVIPEEVYERQLDEIDRMEDLLDDPMAIMKILLNVGNRVEHGDLIYNIRDGILNYMEELLPHQIEEINDMLEE